jgi:polysaccharide pyruvyl transferase WcaK-like protein
MNTASYSANAQVPNNLQETHKQFSGPVRTRKKKIAFFGLFGVGNLGNEITLQTILSHARKYFPDAEFKCICSDVTDTSFRHELPAFPISIRFPQKSAKWYMRSTNPVIRLLRQLLIGIPRELLDWFRVFHILMGVDTLIFPGTGYLTDAYNNALGWPYNVFKWSLIARLLRRKVLFVSVGAGPIYHPLSKWLIKSALSLAHYRSFRDTSTLACLRMIGFSTDNDPVYPDLVFNLDQVVLPSPHVCKRPRPVIGIGLMDDPGRYSVETPSNVTHLSYLHALGTLVDWLLIRNYDVRLLIGDVYDVPVTQRFTELLTHNGLTGTRGRLFNEPAASVDQLLSQVASTDLVVATRFHNVLLSLLLGKPVVGITFHHKGVSLMTQMGLAEYCLDMNTLDAQRLIQQFCKLQDDADRVKSAIRRKTKECREALDQQYAAIFSSLCLS